MKQSTLAQKTGFTTVYIWMVKSGRRPTTLNFARKCEEATGISKLKLIAPEQFGSFWEDLEKI